LARQLRPTSPAPSTLRAGWHISGPDRQCVAARPLTDPYSGALFLFRGRRGDLLKALWWDGQGLALYAKRLERGRFVWPQAKDGVVSLTPAMLSMLLEGIDWRMPAWTARPETAV
jgi:transposase